MTVSLGSMQLAASRTGQEFNQRKLRQGAFWEDRYHATAVDSDEHLHRCLAYIDLNMVSAGVVGHPRAWPHGGYCEIQNPPRALRPDRSRRTHPAVWIFESTGASVRACDMDR